MKQIVFTMELRGLNFEGYLQTNDTTDLPKVFFVFINNYIVGDLMFRKKWIFEQGGRHVILGRLNIGECKYIADYLGNIVELWYE
jgi:hypothetical protein